MPNGDQIYEKQLSAAYWFVTHKLLLKNILVVSLIVLNMGLISFDLYLVINNLVIGDKDYQAILSNLINLNPDLAALRQNKLPAALQISNLRTLANSQGFDIMADLNNPNPKWTATFNYQFKIGDIVRPWLLDKTISPFRIKDIRRTPSGDILLQEIGGIGFHEEYCLKVKIDQ